MSALVSTYISTIKAAHEATCLNAYGSALYATERSALRSTIEATIEAANVNTIIATLCKAY